MDFKREKKVFDIRYRESKKISQNQKFKGFRVYKKVEILIKEK